jgi:hypothetical protein
MVAGEHQKMQEPCTCDQKIRKRRQGGREEEREREHGRVFRIE